MTATKGILLQTVRNNSPRSLTIPDRLISSNTLTVAATLSGTDTPDTTPGAIGDVYVKTTNSKVYVAGGTSAATDWIIVN